MAPIEPDVYNSNIRPLSILGGYFVLAIALTSLISYDVLYKAFGALPPSQDTRHRKSNREKYIQLFALLALVSLATAWYHMLQYFGLSYRVSAYEMGEVLPLAIWGDNGYLAYGEVRLALGRWLKDTSLFRDAWEIVIERSRRYWWSQQIFLGSAAWAVFVGIEGRRRNIHHLWAFLLLGQIVAISFAMNLFFLAVLLTPVPLPRSQPTQIGNPKLSSSSKPEPQTAIGRIVATLKTLQPPLITRPHPPEWTPSPLAIIAPLNVLYFCVFVLPFSTSTPQFWSFLLIPHLVLFRPIYLDRLAPVAYGSTKHPHRTYLAVYRFLSYTSFLLYLKQTFVALLDNDPGAYEHRHSRYLASLSLPHEHEKGAVSRATSSISRVLSALGDHPVMSSVGWDVLMCAISLAVWAVIRGLDIRRIASAAGLTKSHAKVVDVLSNAKSSRERSGSTTSTANATPGRPRRRRKPSNKRNEDAGKDGDFAPTEAEIPTLRGEEEEPENLEAGAVSWVIFALGGLGVLASGVLGAEFET